MANAIPDGEYYIFHAQSLSAGLERVIDVKGSQLLKADADVQIYQPLYNNAQAMQVRNSGGKLIITSRLYGNRFGPNGQSSGTLEEVLNGTAPESVALNVDAQAAVPKNVTWEPVASGRTLNYKGKSYTCYYLKTKGSTKNQYLATQSTANSSPLKMLSTGNNRDWLFVPIDQLDEGGLFEIRSMLSTTMAVGISEGGKTNGSNVCLLPASGGNTQKFVFERKSGTENIYTIREMTSGKYLDVVKNANGANVQIWSDKGTDALSQQWKVLEFGEKIINNTSCKIVQLCSMISNNGLNYAMDVTNSGTRTGTNIQVWEIWNADAQRFALLPSTGEDPNMPVPHSLGTATEYMVGNPSYMYNSSSYGYTTDTTYLTWMCSAAWCTENGANHYELRYRTRTMNPITSAWRSWSSWSGWIIPAVTTYGQKVWSYVEDILGEYEWGDAKNQQLEVELRSVGEDELSLLHSKSITQTMNIYRQPVVDITSAGWTPGGLVLEFSTDYLYGTTYVKLYNIYVNGKQILKNPVELSSYGGKVSGVIDRENLKAFVADESVVQIYFRAGYDQQRECNTLRSDMVAVNYDAGNVDVEPTMEVHGAHVYALVPHLGTERMWAVYGGKTIECPIVEYRNGKTLFEVLYPTNGDEFSLHTEAYSADRSVWGTDASTFKFRHTAYAWTLDDGSTMFLNRFVDERPTFAYSHTATYQNDTLDSRKFSTVSFAPTKTADLTAYGVLLRDDDNIDTVEDFEKLTGQHAIFRDIFGGIHNVAVTNVAVNRTSKYDEISVSMIEETI